MAMLFINLQGEDQDKVKDVSGLSNGLSLSNNLSLWNDHVRGIMWTLRDI